MDGSPLPAAGFRRKPWWLLAVAAVTLGQAGFALNLFGSMAALTDDRPVVSGRHPLHLYHGQLGAETFRDRAATACYDPAFQAGYPKTPVFDGGCRPAELFLVLAGPHRSPAAAYKLGLFAVCLLAPLTFAAAARGAGLSPSGAALAGVGGSLVWWTPPVRGLLDAGSVDLALAGLTGVLFVGGLIRYAADPGVTGWLMLAAAAAAGWYAQPVAWLGLAPVLAGYYVALAPRFGLAWNLGLVGVTAAGLAPNLWWLWDWGKFWWLRQPSVDDLTSLPSWAVVLGEPADYLAIPGTSVVGWAVVVVGSVGLLVLVKSGCRIAAGVVLLAVAFAVAVARLGATWPTLHIVSVERTAIFANAVLVLPAAYLLTRWWGRAQGGPVAVLAAVMVPILLGWGGSLAAPARDVLGLDVRPLPLGLTADQQTFAAALREHTTADARILLEDLEPPRPVRWNWTALLPTLTGRHFLGGLDPEACVEHSYCGLREQSLNGRAFAAWTAAERAAFCRRYNVGWVVCRSPTAIDFWRADPTAREVGRFHDGGEVILFALERPHSYVLAGSATLARLDRRGIVLTDVVPNELGEVVLSLHQIPGFRAAPVGVGVDSDKDPFDPIPFLKLRLPGPVSRLVATWEN